MDLSCRGGRPGIVGESMGTSCTVVMGPSSGTLTLRRRFRLCSLILSLSPLPGGDLSDFSLLVVWFMARAKACSGSRPFPGAACGCSFRGKS